MARTDREARDPVGVDPAKQSFNGLDVLGTQVELRLIVQDQLVLIDGSTELFGQTHVVLSFIQVLDESHERHLAELRPVHGHVCTPNQPGTVGGVDRSEGDPDAGADSGVHGGVEHERLMKIPREALGHLRRVVNIAARQDNGEFVTTEANEQILLAHEPSSRSPSCRSNSSPAGWPMYR